MESSTNYKFKIYIVGDIISTFTEQEVKLTVFSTITKVKLYYPLSVKLEAGTLKLALLYVVESIPQVPVEPGKV